MSKVLIMAIPQRKVFILFRHLFKLIEFKKKTMTLKSVEKVTPSNLKYSGFLSIFKLGKYVTKLLLGAYPYYLKFVKF